MLEVYTIGIYHLEKMNINYQDKIKKGIFIYEKKDPQ